VGEAVKRWDFQTGAEGWRAQNQCSLDAADGVLIIHSTGGDPYLSAAVPLQGSQFAVRLRMRSATGGNGQFFWSSSKHPGSDARRQTPFEMQHDGQWHEYTVPLEIDGDLTALRLDPGTAPGTIEVDWIAVHRGGWHPLEITRFKPRDGQLDVWVQNHGERPLQGTVNGVACELPAGAETLVTLDLSDAGALVSRRIRVEVPGLTPVERQFWTYRPEAALEVVERQIGDLTIRSSRDGSVVRIERGGQQVAALAPLVHIAGNLPALKPRDTAAWPLVFEGDGIRVTLGSAPADLLSVTIESESPVEGPVVRTFGDLEQGLLAGVEYLGRGEHSSSRLDIETAEHLRVEPNPMHLTMPLMAFVTDQASVAMLWEDTALQPTFAAPDFVDYAPGHRMSLKGKSIRAVLRVTEGWPDGGRLEEAILWAVRHRGGLPPLPEPPRSFDEQMQLSLAAYHGLILDPENGGWFHAVVPGSRRMPDRGAPLADCASAIYRITGEMPSVDRLQLGGAHVRNSASFFVSGRAEQWLRIVDGQAESLRRGQLPDGSYRYDGEYRRGHFENTASGVCARPAYILLEHAYFTGNQESLAAGLKALQYIQRFRTPRGAQTWEVPLHTPDILASAHLVWAYVRAYELTGDAAAPGTRPPLGGDRIAVRVPVVQSADHGLRDDRRVRCHQLASAELDRIARPMVRHGLCLRTAVAGAVRQDAGLAAIGRGHPDLRRTDAVPRRAVERLSARCVPVAHATTASGGHQPGSAGQSAIEDLGVAGGFERRVRRQTSRPVAVSGHPGGRRGADQRPQGLAIPDLDRWHSDRGRRVAGRRCDPDRCSVSDCR
jgi:hypothetical protein